MLIISQPVKRSVYNAIIEKGVVENIRTRGLLPELVEKIEGVESLRSVDPRFHTFIDDFYQHCVRNDDWSDEDLFVVRLKVLDNDSVFCSFVDTIVSPEIQEDEAGVNEVVNLVNEELQASGALLSLIRYDSKGLPVYALVEQGASGGQYKPAHEIRQFSFIVDNSHRGRPDRVGGHQPPSHEQGPCFVLVHDRWNDFGVRSLFDLFWYSDSGCRSLIGEVKIIHKTELSEEQMKENSGYDTADYLQSSFTSLVGEAASLGQEGAYYARLKSLFPDCYEDVLWALQDCAIFPIVEERFVEHNQFHSLIRYPEPERLLREEKFLMKGLDVKERYCFSYEFIPKYSESSLTLNFRFGQDGTFPHRLYALIGENGTGKTQFLTALPLSYAKKDLDCFKPHRPIFSRVMTVSMSLYDDIECPVADASFTYDFCGLRFDEFRGKASKFDAMSEHLLRSINEIEKHKRVEQAKDILGKMLPEQILTALIVNRSRTWQFDRKSLDELLRKSSSGETCLLITFCDVIAKIRLNTLLLVDEPETHLHPKAVINMMNTLHVLLEKFNSYAIVATHSALVVREMTADCVYKIMRIGDSAIVGTIKRESLGANLDELNEEIFGAMESGDYYRDLIIGMIKEGYTYEEIMKTLRSKSVDPNLNLRVLVKNYFS